MKQSGVDSGSSGMLTLYKGSARTWKNNNVSFDLCL